MRGYAVERGVRRRIGRQLLLPTAPGVQLLPSTEATRLARLSNDRLAEACAKYPRRFSGLAAFAPQGVDGAVAGIGRAMTQLGLNGAAGRADQRADVSEVGARRRCSARPGLRSRRNRWHSVSASYPASRSTRPL